MKIGRVYWETSADGTARTVHGSASVSDLFPLRALNVMFTAASWAAAVRIPVARYAGGSR